jgi:hypothetical protein
MAMTLANKHSLLPLIACSILLLSGCLNDKCERTQEFIRYDPVYLTEEGIRVDVDIQGPQELKRPGNLYYYNGYLLINEVMKGVHVIDNHDPANPVNLAFIEIPGNRDIAVRNGILYADMFIDLVALDIKDIMNPSLVCRVENVFSQYYSYTIEHGYVVDYVPTSVVQEVDCSDDRWGRLWWRGPVDVLWLSSGSATEFSLDAANFTGQSSGSAPSVGIGGSMARFTLAKDHLYTLDIAQMHVFDLAAACPEKGNSVEMRWGIETLFPYGDYLFVGSNNGMLIYDNSNPGNPAYLSEFAHAQSCDPVFVNDDVAYVTLRDGNACQNFINQLDVLNVSDIRNPTLIRTYPMQNPHGLSVLDETLYLCEGQFGLKVFDVTDKNTISNHRLSWIEKLHAFDVIALPYGNLIMVIGQDGLYQYDATDKSKLVELSRIEISR